MATIRKRGNKYQAQIRKDGYKTVSRTSSSVSVARSWAKAIEADMQRKTDTLKAPLERDLFFSRYQSRSADALYGPRGQRLGGAVGMTG